MKKIRMMAVLLAVALLFVGCGKEVADSEINKTEAVEEIQAIAEKQEIVEEDESEEEEKEEEKSEPKKEIIKRDDVDYFIIQAFESEQLKENWTDTRTEQDIGVYLPPSYYENEDSYPVVYYLHGFQESAKGFVLSSVKEMDQAFADGGKEFILVGVNGANSLGGTYYVNSPAIGNWENYVIEEVVPLVDASYRTLSDSASRGICGFSMGGFGALNLSFKHPDVFGAVYAMSPGLLADGELDLAMETWKSNEKFLQAYAQAFSPNSEAEEIYGNIPEFSGTPEDDAVIKDWENGFGNINQKVDDYMALEKPLAAIKMLYGTNDYYAWIPNGCEFLSDCLNEREIEHIIESFESGHLIPKNILTDDIIPFFYNHLNY